MRQPIRSFKDLIAWQKAFELCIDVHRQTARFPPEERYGLSFDLRKTSRSVVCNIAEGHQRASTREFVRFLDIALASIAERRAAASAGISRSGPQPAHRRRNRDNC